VDGGVRLSVHVIPRAKTTAIAGTRGDALLVRLSAPPVDDAANHELTTFIASRLGLPGRAVRIVSGDRSRRKVLEIAGASVAACHRAGLAP
jgi:uncharacterized protein (TIGR00251 family)